MFDRPLRQYPMSLYHYIASYSSGSRPWACRHSPSHVATMIGQILNHMTRFCAWDPLVPRPGSIKAMGMLFWSLLHWIPTVEPKCNAFCILSWTCLSDQHPIRFSIPHISVSPPHVMSEGEVRSNNAHGGTTTSKRYVEGEWVDARWNRRPRWNPYDCLWRYANLVKTMAALRLTWTPKSAARSQNWFHFWSPRKMWSNHKCL